MEAKELRIGNWVNLFKGVNDNGAIWKYYYIDSGYDIYKLDENDCGDIEPIPLTPEILEKCGFAKTNMADGYKRYTKQGVSIDLPYFEFVYNDGDSNVEIKHLHQLQNLVHALTGEELEVTL